MSSIFSDPPFVRGRTLASGDFGDAQTDPTKNDVLGGGIVGSIKAFQDVAVTQVTIGDKTYPAGTLLSNRLVYCQAVRYRGSDKTAAEVEGLRGTAMLIDVGLENGKPFCQFTNAATNANVDAGREYGVLDEYLTGALKQNDVVWLVRKGPAIVKQAGATAISNGAQVALIGSAGKIAARAGSVFHPAQSTFAAATAATDNYAPIGISIQGAASQTTADSTVRVNLICDDI